VFMANSPSANADVVGTDPLVADLLNLTVWLNFGLSYLFNLYIELIKLY
jgi:hypothetical protein